MARSLTGIRPSGNPHLGNYLGMLKPALLKQSEFECFYFLADLHTLTTLKDANRLKTLTYDITATFLALGFDHRQHLLYRQSDIPLVTELAWYLSSVTGMGLLEKAHAYKDSLATGEDVNHAKFYYPVLMAADILLYDADIVPVGKDQKQHVEMARDMAGSFNAAFKCDALKLPQPLIEDSVASIPGLDGRKMSKSYQNEIPLFCSEKELKSLVMSIKTDSTPLEAPKELDGTLVGQLFEFFESQERYDDLEKRLKSGGLGWGHAKLELFESVNNYISPYRSEYNKLRADEAQLESILKDGAKRALSTAKGVIARVREAVGYPRIAVAFDG